MPKGCYRRKSVEVPEGWMTVPEAAAYADISNHYLLKLRRAGLVRTERFGRYTCINKSDIDAWLARINTPTAKAA
jgi:excisionase family DNA binding protein